MDREDRRGDGAPLSSLLSPPSSLITTNGSIRVSRLRVGFDVPIGVYARASARYRLGELHRLSRIRRRYAEEFARLEIDEEGRTGSVSSEAEVAWDFARSRGDAEHDVEAQLCVICYDSTRDKGNVKKCSRCEMSTCHDCYSTWLKVQIESGNVIGLTCNTCSQAISDADIEHYCTRELAVKYRYYQNKHVHRQNPHAIFCHNASCRALLYERTEPLIEPDVQCTECNQLTCASCHEESHQGRCKRAAESAGRGLRNRMWRRLHAKRCPGCSAWIQKISGCNEVRCTACRTTFCFRCRRPYSPNRSGVLVGTCACSKAAEAFAVAAFITVAVVALPVVLAASVVVAPPLGVAYAVSPRAKKERIKRGLKDRWREFASELHDEPIQDSTVLPVQEPEDGPISDPELLALRVERVRQLLHD